MKALGAEAQKLLAKAVLAEKVKEFMEIHEGVPKIFNWKGINQYFDVKIQ